MTLLLMYPAMHKAAVSCMHAWRSAVGCVRGTIMAHAAVQSLIRYLAGPATSVDSTKGPKSSRTTPLLVFGPSKLNRADHGINGSSLERSDTLPFITA